MIAKIELVISFLLPFAVGGFVYIFASDFIPELHREKNVKKSFIISILFALDILFVLVLKVGE
ncbi:MAG: hypothetical protein U9O20_04930 [Patescibacteria group bacterium]|nr:hypothetical protein [Patescibacteria group bacterium]